MRKIRFVTFLLVMVSISLAQFSAGQKSLDGGVAWASNSNDGEKTSTQLTVDPSLSYFIMNNISIDLTYIYYKYEPENEDSEEMTAFGAGATYYLGNLYFGGSWLDPNADGEEDTYIYEVRCHTRSQSQEKAGWERQRSARFSSSIL